MITTTILAIPLFIIQGILFLIPNSTGLPQPVLDAITTAWNFVNGLSYIFPVSDMLILVVLTFAIEAGILSWRFVNWILHKFPGVS